MSDAMIQFNEQSAAVMITSINGIADAVVYMERTMTTSIGTMNAFNQAEEQAIANTNQFEKALGLGKNALDDMHKETKDLTDVLEKNADQFKDNEKQMQLVKDAIQEQLDMYEKYGIEAPEALKKAADQYDVESTSVENAGKKKLAMFSKIGEKLQETADALSGFVGALGDMGLISKNTQKDLQGFLGGVSELGGGLAKLATNPVAGAIQMISGAFKIGYNLIKMWSEKGIRDAIDKERQFIEISDKMEERIVTLSKKIGDTKAATSLLLGEIIQQAKVTKDNFEHYVIRTGEIIDQYNNKQMTYKQAQEALGSAWTAIIAKAKQLGLEGNSEVVNLINRIKTSGIEVGHVIEHITEKVEAGKKAIIDYINTFDTKLIKQEIEELRKKIKEDPGDTKLADQLKIKNAELIMQTQELSMSYDFVKNYAVSLFNSLGKEGGNTVEKVMKLKDVLLAVDEAAKNTGEKPNGNIAEWIQLAKTFDKVNLEDRIKKLTTSMVELDKTGGVDQNMYASYANEVLNLMKLLEKLGHSPEQAAQAMAGHIKKVNEYSEKYKVTITEQAQEVLKRGLAAEIVASKEAQTFDKVILLSGRFSNALEDNLVNGAKKGMKGINDNIDQQKAKANGLELVLDSEKAKKQAVAFMDNIKEILKNRGSGPIVRTVSPMETLDNKSATRQYYNESANWKSINVDVIKKGASVFSEYMKNIQKMSKTEIEFDLKNVGDTMAKIKKVDGAVEKFIEMTKKKTGLNLDEKKALQVLEIILKGWAPVAADLEKERTLRIDTSGAEGSLDSLGDNVDAEEKRWKLLADQLNVSVKDLKMYGEIHIKNAQALGVSAKTLDQYGESHVREAKRLNVSCEVLEKYGKEYVKLANKFKIPKEEMEKFKLKELQLADALKVTPVYIKTIGTSLAAYAQSLGYTGEKLKNYTKDEWLLAQSLQMNPNLLDKLSTEHRNYAVSVGKTSEYLVTEAEKQSQAFTKMYASLSKDLPDNKVAQAKVWSEATKLMEQYTAEGKEIPKWLSSIEKEYRKTGQAAKSYAEEAAKQAKITADNKKETDQLLESTNNLFDSSSWDMGNMSVNEQVDTYKQVIKQIEDLEKKKKDMGGTLPDDLEKAKKQLEGLKAGMDASMKSGAKVTLEAEKWQDKFKKAGTEIGDLEKDVMGIAGPMAKLGIISGDTVKRIQEGFAGAKEVAGGLAQGAGGIADFASGDFIGGVTGVIGGVSKIASGVKKIWESIFGNKWKKKAKKALKGLEGVTDEMKDKLADRAKELGSITKAENELMAEFIREANITSEKGLEGWAGKVTDMMGRLKNSTGADAALLTQQIGDSFTAMVEKADKLNLHGSKAMVSMIREARQLKKEGKEIPEVFEYVNERLNKGAEAIKTYIDTFGDVGAVQKEIGEIGDKLKAGNLSAAEAAKLQGELSSKQTELNRSVKDIQQNWDFIQTASLSTFTAMMESGKSFIEVVRDMGGQLTGLKDMAKLSGMEISGGLKEMTDLADFVQQNEKLATRIQATNDMMQALGDTSYMTAEDFTNFSNNALSQFDQLLDAGASEKEALRLLGPQLENLIKYQETYNFTLDSQTQSLIKRAEKEGVLAKKVKTEGEQQIEVQERMAGILGAIAEKLGADIPEAFKKMDDSGKKTLSGLEEKWKLTGKEVKTLDRLIKMTGMSLEDADKLIEKVKGKTRQVKPPVQPIKEWSASLKEVGDIIKKDLLEADNQLSEQSKNTINNMINYLKNTSAEGENTRMTFDEIKEKLAELGGSYDELVQGSPQDFLQISDRMREKIELLTETTGDSHAATSMLMGNIIGQAEVTTANFDMYAARTREIIDDYKNGYLDLEQTQESMGEAFSSIMADAQRLGTEGTAEVIGLIEAAKEAGVQVAEIQDYVNGQLIDGVSHLTTYLATFEEGDKKGSQKKKEIGENWEFMQAMAITSFTALQEQGYSFIEVMGMMQQPLADLAQKAKENGLEVGEGLARMTKLADFTEHNKALMTRIEATRGLMESMGKANYLNAQDFALYSQQMTAQYDEVLAKSGDQEHALRLLGPSLESLIKYSETYGHTIDENTQALIDQAKEQGFVAEQTKADSEVTNDLLLLIAETLGATIPENLRNLGGTVNETANQLGNATDQWGNSLSRVQQQLREDLPNAVEGLDNKYQDAMTGHSIVTETEKWASSLTGVEGQLTGNLPESLDVVDKKSALTFKKASDDSSQFGGEIGKLDQDIKEKLLKSLFKTKEDGGVTFKELMKNSALFGKSTDDLKKFIYENLGNPMDIFKKKGSDSFKKVTEQNKKFKLNIDESRVKLSEEMKRALQEMEKNGQRSFLGLQQQTGKWSESLEDVDKKITSTLPDSIKKLDNTYTEHMTGHSIVTETDKWNYSLKEVHQILSKDLIDAAGDLDGEYEKRLSRMKKHLEETTAEGYKSRMNFNQMVEEMQRLQGAYDKLSQVQNRNKDQSFELWDTQRQMAELTKAINEEVAEHAKGISSEISAADINADNFSQYVEKTNDILLAMEMGALSVKETEEAMGQSFNALLGEAQRLGIEGSASMLKMMESAKAAGLEVAEIQQYVNDQLNSGVDAFGKYLNSFGDISGINSKMDEIREQMKTARGDEYRDLETQLAEHQAELDKLTGDFGANFDSAGTYATAMFSSLVAEGATFMEAMEQMGPQLQQLSDMAQAGGVEVSGSVKELLDMQDFIDQNQEVTERISATTEMMTALGNSGYLTGDIFNTFQEDAQAHLKDLGVDMNNLTEGTDKQKEAFQLMGPELAKLAWYSTQYGYELDDNTKKMIAQAEQHGVNMEAMLPPEQQMVNLLEELVDLFSERLPKATDDMADKTEISLKNMKKETGKWKKELEDVEGKLNNGLQDAVNSLDEEYKNAMTGNTIVAETMKWKGSLEEVEEILGRELMEKADDLDKKYSFVHGNIRQYLKDTSKEGFMANMTFDQMVDELVRLQDAHDTLAMKKRRRKNEDQMLDDYRRQINELSAAIKESAPTMENFQKHFRELKENLSGDIGVNAEMIAFTKELKAQGKTLDDIDKQIQDSLTKGAKGLGAWVDALGPSAKQMEEIKKMQEELENLNEKEKLTDAELEKKTDLETKLPDLLKSAKDAMTADMAAFGDTQDILLSYFYSLQAEGKSVAEIMDLMGDSFEAVAAKSLEGEISPEMNSSFAQLYDLQRKIADNEGLIKGIESLSGALHGMGDSMLYMNEDTFGSFERSAMATFQKLKRAGFDETQSLQMVAPLLRDLEAYAAEYGYTLDGSVGSLLERAKASKLIQQEQKSDTERLIDANERLADVMTDMTKLFTDMGDNTPFSIMDEQARKLGISLKDLRQDMMRLISLEAGGVTSPATDGYTSAALGYHGVLGSDRWFRLHKGERVDVWTSEETQRIQATPIRRMNLSDEPASERRGDIVFEHISIQSENGEEAVREFMTAIKGNKYGVQNLIRKVAQ
jgi:hypothetical protein